MKYVRLGTDFIAYSYVDNRPAVDLLIQGMTNLLYRELLLLMNPQETQAVPLVSMTFKGVILTPDGSVGGNTYITSVFKDSSRITVQLDPFTAGNLVGIADYFPDMEMVFAGNPDMPQYYLSVLCKPENIPLIKAILPELVPPLAKKPGCQFTGIPSVTCKLTPFMFARIESCRGESLGNILRLAREKGISPAETPEKTAQAYLYQVCKQSTKDILTRYREFLTENPHPHAPRGLRRIIEALENLDLSDDSDEELDSDFKE